MNFDRIITSWSFSVARKICDGIKFYGPENSDLAMQSFDEITLKVIEAYGGWQKMCELKQAEPLTLRQIWADKARLLLEEKYPKVSEANEEEVA